MSPAAEGFLPPLPAVVAATSEESSLRIPAKVACSSRIACGSFRPAVPLELTAGTFSIEPRQGYLHVIHPGGLATEDEVYVYSLAIEREAARHRVRRLLIDARAERPDERTEVRTALWRWLGTTRVLDGIAIVARDTLAATRINMTALSQRLSIRAYDDPTSAVRWLTRSSRSTGSFRAVSGEEPLSTATPVGLRRSVSTPPPPAAQTDAAPVFVPPAPAIPRVGVPHDPTVRHRAELVTPVPPKYAKSSDRGRG